MRAAVVAVVIGLFPGVLLSQSPPAEVPRNMAVAGTVAGALIGAAIGGFLFLNPALEDETQPPGISFAKGAALGLVAGGVVGNVAGRAIQTGPAPTIRAWAGRWVEGRLVRESPDSLWVAPVGGAPVRALPATTRVEVATTRGHAGTGALIGAGAGLVAAVAVAASSKCTSGGFVVDAGCLAPAGFVVFPLGGAMLGAGIGALVRTREWEPRPVASRGAPGSARLGLAPSPSGVVFTVSASF